jgi:hypothetical protein
MIFDFFLANIIVGLSVAFLVKAFFPEINMVDKLLLWFTLFFAQVIIVELIFGILGKFIFQDILLCHLIIFLIMLSIVRKRLFFSFSKPDVFFVFNDNILLFALLVFISFFSVKLAVNLVNPPFCVDSLQYHLAFPATWIKNHNILNPVCIFSAIKGNPDLSCITFYPINAQLFFAWLMLPLKNAFLADIGEAPFYLIGVIAVYSILRKFSIDKNIALLSGLLWALIPNLFKQLRNGSQIDVICAVLLLLVFNSMLLVKKEFSFKNALIFGISLGILIGTKILNIIWVGALFPIFIFYFFDKFQAISLRKMLVVVVSIFVFASIFGGYIYLKNLFHTGNPFFPIQINIFGKVLFSGAMDNLTYSKLGMGGYKNGLVDLLWKEGLGVQFLMLILPGTFLPLIFFKAIKDKTKPVLEYLFLFLAPVFMLLLYFVFINERWTRYLFPYLSLGLINGVIFFDKFKWGKRYLNIVAFISIAASITMLANGFELVFSVVLFLVLFSLVFLFRRKIEKVIGKVLSLKFLLLFFISMVIVLYVLNDNYNKSEFFRYPSTISRKESSKRDIAFAWQWFNANNGKGAKVGYAGRTEIYPLFGSNLKNEVMYVPVNKISMAPYDLRDGFYRKEMNYSDWISNLRKLNIAYLFIALPEEINNETDLGCFPIEDKWALEHPELFTQVFKNSLAHIYNVNLNKHN